VSGALDLDNNVIFYNNLWSLSNIKMFLADVWMIRYPPRGPLRGSPKRGALNRCVDLCYQSVGELSMAGQSTMLSLLDRNR
jgi:hypothetical protein